MDGRAALPDADDDRFFLRLLRLMGFNDCDAASSAPPARPSADAAPAAGSDDDSGGGEPKRMPGLAAVGGT